jgi:hypothetical protein
MNSAQVGFKRKVVFLLGYTGRTWLCFLSPFVFGLGSQLGVWFLLSSFFISFCRAFYSLSAPQKAQFPSFKMGRSYSFKRSIR